MRGGRSRRERGWKRHVTGAMRAVGGAEYGCMLRLGGLCRGSMHALCMCGSVVLLFVILCGRRALGLYTAYLFSPQYITRPSCTYTAIDSSPPL